MSGIRLRPCVVAVLLPAVLVPALLAATAGPARGDDFYFPPEHYGLPRAHEFVAQAQQYLADHPSEENAPRAAFDLLMIATLTGKAALAQEMKARLLLDYTDSLHALYVLSSMGQVKEFHQLLGHVLQQHAGAWTTELCQRCCRAVRAAGRRFGAGVLSDEKFTLQCALVAHGAGDAQLLAACRGALANASAESKQIAEIAFGSRSSDAQRIIDLHAVEDNATARVYEQHFYQRLPAAERHEPRMLRVAIEGRLAAARYNDALPLIEALLERESGAQPLFWRAWCLAATGREDQARPVLEEIASRHASSPWRESAHDLASRLESLDATLGEHATSLAATVVQLRDNEPQVAEIRATFETKDGRKLELYGAVETPRDHLEGVLLVDGTVVVAYRTSREGTRVFARGERQIVEYPGRGPVPAPQVSLTRGDDGQFRFAWSLPTGGGGVQQAKTALFQSPFLTTTDGLRALLEHTLLAKGWFPAGVVEEDGARRLEWSRPEADEPGRNSVSIHIDREGRIDRLQSSDGQLVQLRYGPAGAFERTPPAWPDLPVVRQDKMDPAVFLRVLAAAMSLFSSDGGLRLK
jgi:hypothetical protein